MNIVACSSSSRAPRIIETFLSALHSFIRSHLPFSVGLAAPPLALPNLTVMSSRARNEGIPTLCMYDYTIHWAPYPAAIRSPASPIAAADFLACFLSPVCPSVLPPSTTRRLMFSFPRPCRTAIASHHTENLERTPAARGYISFPLPPWIRESNSLTPFRHR